MAGGPAGQIKHRIRATLIVLLAVGLVLVPTGRAEADDPAWPDLKRGSSGTLVKELQKALTAKGIRTTADGKFGPKTEASVKTFQTQSALPVTGVVDNATWVAVGLGHIGPPAPPPPPNVPPGIPQSTYGPICVPGSLPITGLVTDQKVVTFTFDDGPSRSYTKPIVDEFASRGLQATFFIPSLSLSRRSDIALYTTAAGHELGNHSHSHGYSPTTNAKEVAQAQGIFESVTGVAPIFYRHPGLSWSKRVLAELGKQGVCAIDTNMIVGDWTVPRVSAAVLCSRFKRGLKPGTIVVLHDGGNGHLPTVKAVPCMLDHAAAQGYQVLGLRDFLAIAEGDPARLTYRKVTRK